MKKTTIKSQRTETEYKNAAAELFVRDGYEKTSVNGIVEKAGCSVRRVLRAFQIEAGAGLADLGRVHY